MTCLCGLPVDALAERLERRPMRVEWFIRRYRVVSVSPSDRPERNRI